MIVSTSLKKAHDGSCFNAFSVKINLIS